MSKRDARRSQAVDRNACRRKRAHLDQPTALAFAALRMERGAPKLKAYRCPHCGRWHLAKKNRKNRPRRRS